MADVAVEGGRLAPLDVRRPFTRADAIAAGISPALLRGSTFRRIFRNVYIRASVRDNPLIRVQAALLIHPPGAFASYASAARVYDVPLPALPDEHVSVFAEKDRRRRDGIRNHVAPAGQRVVLVRGIPVCTPEDLFVQLSEILSLVDLVVVGDALVRLKRTTPEALVARCADAGALARRGQSGRLFRLGCSGFSRQLRRDNPPCVTGAGLVQLYRQSGAPRVPPEPGQAILLLVAGGKRRAEQHNRAGPRLGPLSRLGGTVLGMVCGCAAWWFLVRAAIDFARLATRGEPQAWGFAVAASVGAVGCLLLVLVLGSRVLVTLGVVREYQPRRAAGKRRADAAPVRAPQRRAQQAPEPPPGRRASRHSDAPEPDRPVG
jgi:hypothetical protein